MLSRRQSGVKTILVAGMAAVALATNPAFAVPPSGATCIASPNSKDPYTEGKDNAERDLNDKHPFWSASPDSSLKNVQDETAAAKRKYELHHHAVEAIMGFLARVKGEDYEWTPANVTEAAGIPRDLGLDVWQVRSFVGEGKGGKLHGAFLSQVTKALTGDTLLPFPLTESDDYWHD
jgi:hypothetical protein